MKSLFRTKPHTDDSTDNKLVRCLNASDLTLLGIGATIGAGIFVVAGIAAATKAGPAIIISFILAALACGFTALAYAELAASLGGCGSAYGYAYVSLGELPAWIIGWNLVLEYAIGLAAVAVGWSHYFNNILNSFGWQMPAYLLAGPADGGLVNLPAVLIIALVSLLLLVGTKTSVRFNAIMVLVKLAVILLFIVVAFMNVNPINWTPFMPFGWSGVMSGAAIIFFAYIGFDAVSTAAEEVINPQRNLPLGIIASLVVCTVLYIAVAALLTGVVPYASLNVGSPVSFAMLHLGYNFMGGIVAVGAIAGLTTVILVLYYGLSRIFLAMSRDQLLPTYFAKLHPVAHTPNRIVVVSGIIMMVLAGFVPINALAELTNIGTLSAFIIVCVGVIVLRYTQPNIPRPFKTPFSPLIPSLGIAFCLFLMLGLSATTWVRFVVWTAAGLVIYFMYSRSNSLLGNSTVVSETH